MSSEDTVRFKLNGGSEHRTFRCAERKFKMSAGRGGGARPRVPSVSPALALRVVLLVYEIRPYTEHAREFLLPYSRVRNNLLLFVNCFVKFFCCSVLIFIVIYCFVFIRSLFTLSFGLLLVVTK